LLEHTLKNKISNDIKFEDKSIFATEIEKENKAMNFSYLDNYEQDYKAKAN
jgi:hypothetical protein